MMTHEADWVMMLWSAKTFYMHSGVRWPLVIHEGGTLSDHARGSLKTHFPNCRIITLAEADELVKPALASKGLRRLSEARARNVMYRKLVDCVQLCNAENVLLIDPDVLFFGRPHDLVSGGANRLQVNRFCQDFITVYSLSPEEAMSAFGIKLASRINTGICLMNCRSIDLEFMDTCCANSRINGVPHLAEQTLHALHASVRGFAFLPDTYVTATVRGTRTASGARVIAKHYPAAPRPMYYIEGLAMVIACGVLRRGSQKTNYPIEIASVVEGGLNGAPCT